jgi:hypothetical protein
MNRSDHKFIFLKIFLMMKLLEMLQVSLISNNKSFTMIGEFSDSIEDGIKNTEEVCFILSRNFKRIMSILILYGHRSMNYYMLKGVQLNLSVLIRSIPHVMTL